MNVSESQKHPTVTHHGTLLAFSFRQFAANLGYETRRRAELEERRKVARQSMWPPRGAKPLAEPPVIYLDDIMQDIGSDRRYEKLWQNDPGKGSTMKDLVAEGRVIGNYDGWATEMSNDDPDIARREFYGQLMKKDLGVEGDAVCEEWRELSSTANPLGLFELLYIDNDGETTRIKALWEGGQVLGYEDDPAVQAVYGDVLNDYAVARFEKWQLDEDDGTKELERRLRAGEYVAGWTHPRVQEKYDYLASSDDL